MSGIDSAASMFLRSGPLPTAAVDTAKGCHWGHSAVHCSGFDFGGSEGPNVPSLHYRSDSWQGDGREWSIRDNLYLKPSLRSSLPPQCDVPSLFPVPPQGPGMGATRMHSLADCGIRALRFLGSFPGRLEGRMNSAQKAIEVDKTRAQYTQELIRALQTGGSRTKMEAAIAVRSLAASHNFHQVALIAAGGLRPLVDLLSYEAGETHWPPEMREKATITVRAEAALALASLSVSNDENKGAIGAAGAIPLLCDLIQFDEESYNPSVASYQKQEMAPFLILARDAGAGALSCLAKNESNKDAMIAANAVPVLVRMVDHGTSFGRAAAANVLAKLAIGGDTRNKVIVGKEGAIPALLRLIKQGSPKARETAAEALANLALHEWNKAKIIKEGGIDCLSKMMESCSQAEKDSASAALKVLQSPMGSDPKPQVGKDLRNWFASDTRQDNSGMRQLRREDATNGYLQQMKNTKECSGDHPRYNKDVSASQRQGIVAMSNANLSDLSSPLATMQTVFTTELTSSLAPPLVGQPSIPVDAVVGCGKDTAYMAKSTKRMKLSHPPFSICGPQYMKSSTDDSNKVKNPIFYPGDTLLATHNEDRRCIPALWGRLEENLYQGQGFNTSSYPYGDMAEPKERFRQSGEGRDVLPISGGISALVNALSSQNPGAQEFSALALMLLGSQGGYEVKTAIADAGALPPLILMVSSSGSPMIRESAAAAISKLVSCHPVNRAALVQGGGVMALVEMVKWSSRLMDGVSGGGSLGGRTQAAAIVALLSLSEVLDKPGMGVSLREALPSLAHMLESDSIKEVKAGVGGLQALSLSLIVDTDHPVLKETSLQQDHNQNQKFDCVPIELVTSLLDLTQGSNHEAKEAATESLAGFRKVGTASAVLDARKLGDKDQIGFYRKEGLDALLLLLQRGPSTASVREIVAGTFACVVASEKLHSHLAESSVVPHLMRLLQEGPTITTTILAAAAIANLGAKKKRLETISTDDMPLLLRLLNSDFEGLDSSKPYSSSSYSSFPRLDNSVQHSHYQANLQSVPYLLLREHATAILVYTALSGEKEKQSLIAAGAAPIFVRLLQSCVASAEMSTTSWGHASFLQPTSNLSQLNPIFPQATQEFAIMGLILIADKNPETMVKVVEARGIPTLVKLLSMTGGRGRLGASWSEMAAAALLTLAGCDAAREEMIRVGGITSLVQVLKGEGGASIFSLTGLAAMAQLLGVLAQNSSEAKLQMAKVGAVRCLVEILVGGGYLAWAADGGCPREEPGLVALAQEAAAAALATVVLHCPGNAEAAVEAGAIGPLIRLLGALSTKCEMGGHTKLQLTSESESGASSAETGITNDGSRTNVVPSCIAVEEDAEGFNYGGPLAAMAALGNMISSYPQCGREIIDAGGLTRLLNLLQLKPKSLVKETDPNKDVSPSDNCDKKVQEGALLVLGLLAEGDADVQEAIGCAVVMPASMKFSSGSRSKSSTTSTTGHDEKEFEVSNKETKEDNMASSVPCHPYCYFILSLSLTTLRSCETD